MKPISKYIARKKVITRAEAEAKRAEDLAHIQAQITNLEQERSELSKSTLILESWFQEEVFPGHPDYDEKATFHFSPEHYAGEMKWVN